MGDQRVLGFLLAGALASGCAAELGGAAGDTDHTEAEVRLSQEEIAAEWETGEEWIESPPLDAPNGVSRVGVLLSLHEQGLMPRIEARLLGDDGTEGPWLPVTETWGEEDHFVGIASFDTTGVRAQLRIAKDALPQIAVFRWNAVVPEESSGSGDAVSSEVAGQSEALRSELSGLGIVTRSAWGARATRCTSVNSSKSRIAIHHTVTGSTNPARQLRGIQNYHMDSRGWCDVGYHFLVGSDGKVYEGRPLHLLGAHVGGHNTGNIGISFIGCFQTSGCSGLGPTTPSNAMLQAAGRLSRELSRLYRFSITSSTLKGHRDHSGQSTSCPGANLHSRLGTIRSIATSSTSTPPPSGGAGSCTHSYGGTYANRGCSAGWQCCDGRWGDRGSCGACACVETTGRVGCSGGPPAGASCTHTYGGRYANTACSPSWQCCNGRWGSRGSCGSCYCTESTGTRGCGT